MFWGSQNFRYSLLSGSVLIALLCCDISITSISMAGTFRVENRKEIRLIVNRVRASQFLSRTTFGPRLEEIEALAKRMTQIGTRRACSEWIDQQMTMPVSHHIETIDQMLAQHNIANDSTDHYLIPYRYHAFHHNAIRGRDQLRQRVAWALSQIFVVSDLENNLSDKDKNLNGDPIWYGFTSYYDKLLNNAFGDYRTLLSDVALHPIMGHYLSHLRNSKAEPSKNQFPDENFAREIMQLFSIGLYELHTDGRLRKDSRGNLIATYDMDTVRALASVFTGLTMHASEDFHWTPIRDFTNSMEMWEEHHETGEKKLLRGMILPAHNGDPGDGIADINAALDNIASHPNVAPFIARILIQRLVRSNPSRGYVRRVVRAYYGGGSSAYAAPEGTGNLGAMIKAILIDPEAFRGTRGRVRRQSDGKITYSVIDRGTEWSRMQEPMLYYLAVIRGLFGKAFYNGSPTAFAILPRMHWEIGQSPFGSPSVFSFYLPDYQPPGPLSDLTVPRRLSSRRLVAPEFSMLTPLRNNRIANLIKFHLYTGKVRFDLWQPNEPYPIAELRFDYSQFLNRIDTDREGLLESLDLQFCRGNMPDETRQDILDAIETVSSEQPWTEDYDRVVAMLNCVIGSPDCWVVP